MSDLNPILLKKRHAREKRFKFYGQAAIVFVLLVLSVLLINIFGKGYSAFLQTQIKLTIQASAEELADPNIIPYARLITQALLNEFPEATDRRSKRNLKQLITSNADLILERKVTENPDVLIKPFTLWVPANDDIDMLNKGAIDRALPAAERSVNNVQIKWFDQLKEQRKVRIRFNTMFFTQADSREPELAGIAGATAGSFFTMIVTLILSLPLGVATAIYLQEFAKEGRFTRLIEANINNLAAVPSIVFGLLGLAIFLNFFGMPRSAPLVGGIVLSLMTLPTIIIATRAALRSVPPSIRNAALGMGASKMEVVAHHVLPLAFPGILTGTIIGMAQALGETAPLLMIGMVAFVVDIPTSPTDPSTVLPVQVFLWSNMPERAFVEKASAASMILLVFLIFLNATAIILRKKFETRW